MRGLSGEKSLIRVYTNTGDYCEEPPCNAGWGGCQGGERVLTHAEQTRQHVNILRLW